LYFFAIDFAYDVLPLPGGPNINILGGLLGAFGLILSFIILAISPTT